MSLYFGQHHHYCQLVSAGVPSYMLCLFALYCIALLTCKLYLVSNVLTYAVCPSMDMCMTAAASVWHGRFSARAVSSCAAPKSV